MRLEKFNDHDYSAQWRRADALATAIAWSTRAVAGLLQTAAAALRRALNTATVWHRRVSERRELLSLEERDLRDMGLSRYDALYEGRKPFWRA